MRRFEHKDNQRQLNKYFQVGEVMCVYVYMCVCMCVCVYVCVCVIRICSRTFWFLCLGKELIDHLLTVLVVVVLFTEP